jgi:STE24 endopeptidase
VRRTLRLPVALVAAVVVAEVAVLFLRPHDSGPEPVVVNARAYFSPAQLEKGQDFRSGQLALYGASLLIEGGVLILLVRRPPRRLRKDFRRPLVAAAVAGAVLSVTLGLAALPVSAISRERSKDVGLVTQGWADWAGDVAKGEAISAVFAAGGAALLLFGMRRFGPRWWAPGAVVVVAFGVAFTYAGPVVLDPVFNDFTRLPAGQTRSDVLELAARSGLKVGEAYEVDASRRTTAANAYVTGLGKTKRVVVYDNLIKDFTPAETRLVVAHELGHVRHHDVIHGLLYLALVAPFGMLAVALLAERLGPREGRATPAALPAVALAIALVAPTITVVSNQLSRAVESRADAFALELTHDPRGMIEFQRRIAIQNVADLDPPAWQSFLLGTHPTTLQRIGAAVAYERGRR